MKRKNGFTLIELLIVVAIIAILAAIAVPNFLEAQTRAKVTRVYSDMRSLATAIESYTVDYNRPPASQYEMNNLVTPSLNVPGEYPFGLLTTPVAYITTIPRDPFANFGLDLPDGTKNYGRDHFKFDGFVDPNKTTHRLGKGLGYQWVLTSWGPSKTMADPADPTKKVFGTQVVTGLKSLFVYDSTNGTKSLGLIIRTSKGVYAGADYVYNP